MQIRNIIEKLWTEKYEKYKGQALYPFTPHLIDEGTGVHDSALLDLRQTGRLDIVGKPLHGEHKWHIFAWFNQPDAESTTAPY
jgi:hypothetical protein